MKIESIIQLLHANNDLGLFLATWLLFLGLIFAAQAINTTTFYKKGINLAEIIYFASITVFHPLASSILILIGEIKDSLSRRKKLDAKFFKTYLSFISIAIIYYIFYEINLFARFNLRIILAFSLAGLVYIFIKKRMLKEDYKVSLFVMAPLGFLLTILWHVNFWGFIILFFPLTIIYFSLRSYNDLLEEVRGTLKNLAILVDKKEPMALHHSTRVALFSQKIAEEFLLSKEEIESIYNAALIHDLGKISIDDDTLAKSTPLTFDEYERIKKHPLTGARIASALNLYKDEALIVKYHHEKYDGSGYPEKLKGEAIPIGSRIIAVAETFETLISPRSYKKVSTHKEALEIIKNESGKHFDPKIVAAFLKVYEKGLIK